MKILERLKNNSFVWKALVSSVALLLFFQNCGDIKVDNMPSRPAVVAPTNVENIKGTFCHLVNVASSSTYRLSNFYLLNLTAHKFNGQLHPDNNLDGMIDKEPLNSIGETVAVSNLDSDADGLPDFVEKLKGLNPTTSDADKDGVDLDGVINRREIQLGTDPSFRGDAPAIDYTIEPATTGIEDCGTDQPAYQFKINKMLLTQNRAFTDTVNSDPYNLTHGDGENILLALAKLSPDDVRKPSVFVVKFFKIDANNLTTPQFFPDDFYVLGEASDSCPECNEGLTGAIYKKIFAGEKHSCALSTQDYMICWGDNSNGQLGDATNSQRVVPVKPKLNEKISSMALGSAHTCAITFNKEVFCWGANSFGQLGIGNQNDQSNPTRVNLGTTSAPVHIMAGASHTCVTFEDNSMKCWGRNDLYQLGNNTNTSSLTPVNAVMPSSGIQYPIVHVSSRGDNSCFTSTGGTSFCWGRVSACAQNTIQRIPSTCAPTTQTFPVEGIRLTSTWSAVETNGFVNTGIAKNALGNMTCWGSTIYSSALWGYGCGMQADNGTRQEDDQGNLLAPSSELTIGVSRVLKVKMAVGHSCAVWNKLVNATTGELKRQLDCWGVNGQGAIGQPPSGTVSIPSTVSAIKEPLDVAVGTDFSCAIDKDGIIWCWGVNTFGQLGSGDIVNNATPTKVKNQ